MVRTCVMVRKNKAANELQELKEALLEIRKPGDFLSFLDKLPERLRGHEGPNEYCNPEFIQLRNKTFDASPNPSALSDAFYELIIGKPPEKEKSRRL